jgi:tetratricopeptide (TPR) repeat protein
MRFSAFLLALPLALSAQTAPQTPEQLISARKLDEVRAIAQGELAKNKNDPHAFYLLGRVALVEEKNGDAIEWFEKAVKYEETSSRYHLWLGNALGQEAQRANKLRQPFLARRVKSEFERAVALDPSNIDARDGLVDFYSMAPGFMGGSMDKAKAQAAEMIKLDPVRGNWALGDIATREKDVPGQERAYKAAVAAAPDSAPTHFVLASFFRRQSRWAEAFDVYEQLMKKPDQIFAHAGWGITAAQSGTQLERGERELRYYLANQPKDAPNVTQSAVHFRLGQILERTGRKDQARPEYAEAVKLNPQNQDAKKALDALK